MATIRKRGGKYEVQIRRKGQASVSRSLLLKSDAFVSARLTGGRVSVSAPSEPIYCGLSVFRNAMMSVTS